MFSAAKWTLAASGVFAVHELIHILFEWVWPQPWFRLAYSLSETVFILILIYAIYRLGRAIPRSV